LWGKSIIYIEEIFLLLSRRGVEVAMTLALLSYF
jgi:hypothetical protein